VEKKSLQEVDFILIDAKEQSGTQLQFLESDIFKHFRAIYFKAFKS
jgi:hypothetical protein